MNASTDNSLKYLINEKFYRNFKVIQISRNKLLKQQRYFLAKKLIEIDIHYN